MKTVVQETIEYLSLELKTNDLVSFEKKEETIINDFIINHFEANGYTTVITDYIVTITKDKNRICEILELQHLILERSKELVNENDENIRQMLEQQVEDFLQDINYKIVSEFV